MNHISVKLVDGRQVVNGQEVEFCCNADEGEALITDSADHLRLAEAAFAAGAAYAGGGRLPVIDLADPDPSAVAALPRTELPRRARWPLSEPDAR